MATRKSIFNSFSVIPTRITFFKPFLKENDENIEELANTIFKRVFESQRGRIEISKNYTRFIALIVNYNMSEKNLEDIKSRFQNGVDGSLLESNFENVHAVLSGDFYEDIDSYRFSLRGEGEFPEDTMCIFFYCSPSS